MSAVEMTAGLSIVVTVGVTISRGPNTCALVSGPITDELVVNPLVSATWRLRLSYRVSVTLP